MGGDPLTAVVRVLDGRSVVELTGELDPETVEQFAAAVDDAASHGHPTVVVDLAGVTFVDSAGLRALVRARDQVAPAAVVLSRPSPFARRLLTITKLDDQFEIEP